MEECAVCENEATFIRIVGGWYVCRDCIVNGKAYELGEYSV